MSIREELESTSKVMPVHKVIPMKYVLRENTVIIGLSHISRELDLARLKSTIESKGKNLLIYLHNPYKKINGVTYKKYLDELGIEMYKGV